MSVSHCPYCGCREITSVLSDGMSTYRCPSCGNIWNMNSMGLTEKYKVYKKDGTPVDIPNFVLLLSDPAARVALYAYAAATTDGVLAMDLKSLLARVESKPEDYPICGSAGLMNRGVTCNVLESQDIGVIVINKRSDE